MEEGESVAEMIEVQHTCNKFWKIKINMKTIMNQEIFFLKCFL